ncbi:MULTISPECIES: RDD family protein [unclassified Streptomyces]|uniref:RDD family protein n=1 Tax=unclassified Streptomyces TaxID=2593676 RepID=UPI002E2945D7|nr:RDD family protein [Streptomyces sp. NBC_00223]
MPHVTQPPDPANPYGGQPQQPYGSPPPQQPYGYPQQPSYPQQGPYGGQPDPYAAYPQPPGGPTPYYPQNGLPPGMPPLASWGARVGATLLDGLMFMLIPIGLIMAGYVQFISKFIDAQDACDRAGTSSADCPTPDLPGSALGLIAIGAVLSLIAALYLCYREGKTGQTPGKRIVGIRLLKEYDGATLGFGLAFGRRLLHVVDGAACYLGYLWPLWDNKNQTFTDKIVHTVVIKDRS